MFRSKLEKFLEKEVSRLQSELAEKNQQIEKLQAAIISKAAPMAYFEHYGPKEQSGINPDVKKRLEDMKILNRFAQMQEEPLFSNADEAVDILSRMMNPPGFEKPIHDNSES